MAPRRRPRAGRLALVVVALAAAGPLLAGCGSSGANTLVLYSGQHVQTTEDLIAGFEKQSGIAVRLRSDDEDTLADQIVTEGSHSPADVVFSENSPALEYLEERGALAPVDPSTLSRVPAADSSARGRWVGVSARVSVLVYNPRRIAPAALPHTILDLADPRYRGRLALAPSETDFQPIVTSVLDTYGHAAALRWLQGLKANAAGHTYADNEMLCSQINRGSADFGLVNQYYWYRMRAQIGRAATHSALAYLNERDPGYVLDVSGAGVLASSRHRRAAQRFLAFLVSRTGQQIIARSISFEYPIGSGVRTVQPERPFDQLRPYPISLARLGDGSRAIALLKEVGVL